MPPPIRGGGITRLHVATSNRSRFSIRSPKIVATAPCKIWLLFLMHVCAHVGGCKDLGGCWDPDPWDGGVADLQKHASPHLCYRAKFRHFRSNHTSLITEICQKNLTPRVGHSSSLELTWIDLLPMTSCSWSIITTGLSRFIHSYSFNVQGDITQLQTDRRKTELYICSC